MTSLYLGLALTIAITINARSGLLRALGRLIAAVAMAFMAWSIVLANRDGTFAAVPAGNITPLLLNTAAGLLVVALLLLLASMPRALRPAGDTVPLRSTAVAYGHATRGLHWAGAVLVIAAFVIGLFVAILPETRPERAEFLAAHLAIGGAVFLLTMARMFERLVRAGPPTRGLVMLAHFALYALVIAICVTGLALTDAPIPLLGLSLPNLPADPIAAPLHRSALPWLFVILLAGHLMGAVKAIRRMAR